MLASYSYLKATHVAPLALSLFTSAASAETLRTGTIDDALSAGLDFRGIAFEACLAETTCTVGSLTVQAERSTAEGSWSEAQIYWEPIDGLGVLGGRQNDEIDADERLVLTFGKSLRISGIWLSDLFIGEGQRYNEAPYTEDDVETATISLVMDKTEVLRTSVHGVFELPNQPFESTFTNIFSKDGDLLNRVLVDDTSVTMVMPDGDSDVAIRMPLGKIDPGKQALFAQNAVSTVDLATLIGDASAVAVFKAGTSNASRILQIRDDLARLEELRKVAEVQRRIGDAENGELGWYPPEAQEVKRIVLTAELSTSNDYSVAGLTVAGPFDTAVDLAGLAR